MNVNDFRERLDGSVVTSVEHENGTLTFKLEMWDTENGELKFYGVVDYQAPDSFPLDYMYEKSSEGSEDEQKIYRLESNRKGIVAEVAAHDVSFKQLGTYRS